ncbi:EAL domain-containing protein [Clostridium sp. MD294]|uniref:EAL domain-containing protein n=1 Tax=Clostridium sp. MD294 TaxID=97138 RepID=UPI0002C8F5D6|nr:EAL domain-containing protein [Clostridium sp. MD294]NDO45588.1 EAL domain-containing protein [Clostridium sp. MD294]USF30758.1 hypothetical protein C820_002201 [Clostridium sp. MD294]
MKFLNKFFKKENRFFIYAMIVVIALIAVVTKFSIYYMGMALEKNNEILLNEISQEGADLVSEKISSDIEKLRAAASIIGKEEDLFSQKNIEDIEMLAQDEAYNKVLLIDMDGNMRNSDGEQGKQVTIIARVKRNNIVISDVTTTDAGENILTISVPVTQKQKLIGALTGVYKAEDFSQIMETTLFAEEGAHYILKNTGEAVALPENEVYPFGFQYENTFEGNTAFYSVSELSKLPQEMKQGKTGIIRFVTGEHNVNYMSYRPLEWNDWYLISVIPAGKYSMKNVTDIVIKFALLIDIVIIILAAIIIANHKGNKKVVGGTDTITSLENKQEVQKFYENINKNKSKNKNGYAFAMIGIDDFDILNHTFGYEKGSQILRETADIISTSLEKEEIAARLKEDYFGLLLKAKNKSEVTRRIEEIIANLSQIKIREGEAIYNDAITYSAAINLLSEKESFETMLPNTIAILELAKQSHDEKILFYDKELRQQILLHNELLPDMLAALQNKEFIPYFEIQFDTEQKEFIGAEAIAVWKHPQKGFIMSENFASVLKTAGILLNFDMILLEEVCKKQKDCIDRGLVPLPITVSISRLNIHRTDFVNKLKTIVERYQISPSLIILEIAEQAIYDDIDRNTKIITECKEYGFMISIADFSRGYSFLDIMRRVSVDSIKLSGEFLPQEDPTEKDRIIIKNIIDIAKELGIQIIAEHIQSEKQVKFLKVMGCSIIQGYSYTEPVSSEELEEMIFYEEI